MIQRVSLTALKRSQAARVRNICSCFDSRRLGNEFVLRASTWDNVTQKYLDNPLAFQASLRSRSVLLIPAPLLFVWLDEKYCVPPDKAAKLGQRYPLDYLRF